MSHLKMDKNNWIYVIYLVEFVTYITTTTLFSNNCLKVEKFSTLLKIKVHFHFNGVKSHSASIVAITSGKSTRKYERKKGHYVTL